jgi:hypothetical protein
VAILDLVCLANSQKHGGRCVAGITTAGSWVRPVSSELDGTLSPRDYTLGDGSEPALLDVIRLEASHSPKPHQPENWQISGAQWQRLGRLGSQEARRWLHQVAIPGPQLLGSPADRFNYTDLVEHPIHSSLCVVEPAEARWHITSNFKGMRQIRANFKLAGEPYNLPVSDPHWAGLLSRFDFGYYSNSDVSIARSQAVFLTVSLTEPFNGSCFKLIAAVVVL